MFKPAILFKTALIGMALCSAPKLMAVEAFGDPYTAVSPVSTEQAQVVYYRAKALNSEDGAAHVYVDREFQSALLPGGFTTFCVAPGSHTVGSYSQDAPQYKGKSAGAYSINLEGGKTYFLRVGEGSRSAPYLIKRPEAERELAGSLRQIQALSRASSVQACTYSTAFESPPFKPWALPDGTDPGNWTAAGQATVGGVAYEVYNHCALDAELLVQQGVTTNPV